MLIAVAFAALIQTAPTPPPPTELNGAWTVDLSVDPAQPYVRPMHLSLMPDGTVTGDFYMSEIQAGRWRRQNGRLCVSFRTTDGEGPYHTAACLTGDGSAEGQTWAEHRDFVFVWTAKRGEPVA